MEDIKNSVASRWQRQPPLKTIFISILQMKSSSTCKSLLPSAKGLSFTSMLSQPTPLYLKQAFELLCFIHPYVDLFNHVYYLLSFSTMLLSERIYLWKLSMIAKSLLCWAYGFCYISSVIKGSIQKYVQFVHCSLTKNKGLPSPIMIYLVHLYCDFLCLLHV
jgi:hypothetical protein